MGSTATGTTRDDRLLTAEDERRLAQQIEAGVLAAAARADPASLPAAAASAQPAATDPELALIEDAGRAAWQRFVAANLGLVRQLASREAHRCRMPDADLFQEGCLALMSALQRYDHRRGVRFSTYAVPWIRAAILAASARRLAAADLPAWRAGTIRRVRAAEAMLAVHLGRMPSAAEVGARFDRDAAWVSAVLAHRVARSLDDPAVLGELAERPDPASDGSARLVDAALLDDLPAPEREVLRWRFGYVDGEPHSIRDTAARLGIGRRRLAAIEADALQRLRRRLLAESA